MLPQWSRWCKETVWGTEYSFDIFWSLDVLEAGIEFLASQWQFFRFGVKLWTASDWHQQHWWSLHWLLHDALWMHWQQALQSVMFADHKVDQEWFSHYPSCSLRMNLQHPRNIGPTLSFLLVTWKQSEKAFRIIVPRSLPRSWKDAEPIRGTAWHSPLDCSTNEDGWGEWSTGNGFHFAFWSSTCKSSIHPVRSFFAEFFGPGIFQVVSKKPGFCLFSSLFPSRSIWAPPGAVDQGRLLLYLWQGWSPHRDARMLPLHGQPGFLSASSENLGSSSLDFSGFSDFLGLGWNRNEPTWQARVADNATVVSTSTRNFPNRLGKGNCLS